jgi:pimeloyl-ACP methyl ester carboxylesterase
MSTARSPLPPRGPGPCCRSLLLCGLLAALPGCSEVTVRPAGMPDLLEAWRDSSISANDLSPRTLQTFRRFDLEETYRRRPAEAVALLRQRADADPQPELLFALTEACFLQGRLGEKSAAPDAYVFYYLCAGYAYHFLFDGPCSCENRGSRIEDRESKKTGAVASSSILDPRSSILDPLTVSAFDPRFRLACDFYNAALSKWLRAVQRAGRLDPRQELHLPTVDGKGFVLSVAHLGFAWQPEEFGPLLFCEDFKVVGLNSLFHSYGLGVPLIGNRAEEAPAPAHAFYPRKVSFPVTAFLRFDGTVAQLSNQHAGRLELYNPLTIQTLKLCERSVPLETDLTTPLAYFLANSDLRDAGVTGFVAADKLQERSGIYMFEPYQPGKVPVVMVHGLLSSPISWAPLFNELRADPRLRQRYQFWFYLYPTGNPYLATAADLRDTLGQLRHDLDPGGHDAALDNMVLVGHSMGGLIARLLTTDSGDDFWHLVSNHPLDSLKAQPETARELRRVFYFRKQPYVRRVVFLATPHHGSGLSPSLPGRLASRLVHLPQSLQAAAEDLTRENPQAWDDLQHGLLPTSVDLLAPGAPALQLLADRPLPADVHFHSIIAVLPPTTPGLTLLQPAGTEDKRTDGVVPYVSAHLDGVESELVVPSNHLQLHHHPLVALEIRRILLEHQQPPR